MPFFSIWGSPKCHFIVYGGFQYAIFLFRGSFESATFRIWESRKCHLLYVQYLSPKTNRKNTPDDHNNRQQKQQQADATTIFEMQNLHFK